MEKNLARSEIFKETNVHFSLHVPSVVDLTLDIQRKTHINRYRFFDNPQSIEMQSLKTKNSIDCDLNATTKF